MFKSTFTLICFLFLSLTAQAVVSIQATVSRVDRPLSQTYVKFSPGGPEYRLYSRDHNVLSGISKLSVGDHIKGSGHIYVNSSYINLVSLEFVGLKKLIGSWRTTNWEFFEFKDFKRLHYYQSFEIEELSGFHFKEMRYSIAPANETNWTILLIDDSEVNVGSLQLNDRELVIEVFGDGDQPDRKFTLQPVGRH